MSSFIITCMLSQQTPMIHFQHQESGACLRGSDLKPKLDRFLLEQLGRGDDSPQEAGLCIASKNGWLSGDNSHPALDYKVRIFAEGNERERTLIRSNTIKAKVAKLEGRQMAEEPIEICRSYFGNMPDMRGANTLEEKVARVEEVCRETIFYTKPIQLKIICFIPEFCNLIRKHLPGFFLLHNFGTRSSKGFGSFVVTEIDGKPEAYEHEALIARYFPHPFYIVNYSYHDHKKQMDDIADLYQLMKSGLNDPGEPYHRAFIYEYMHTIGIGNEKAWMKKNGISPVVFKPVNAHNGEHDKQSSFTEYRYVRAMLGKGDSIRYVNGLDASDLPSRGAGATIVIIVGEEKEKSSKPINQRIPLIQRFASPILFKVAGNHTYMLPYSPSHTIMDRPFEFTGRGRRGIIWTPKTFDMCNFAQEFANYVNSSTMQSRLKKSKRLGFRGSLLKCP